MSSEVEQCQGVTGDVTSSELAGFVSEVRECYGRNSIPPQDLVPRS